MIYQPVQLDQQGNISQQSQPTCKLQYINKNYFSFTNFILWLYTVFNIGGNLVQFSGAATLASNSSPAITQASGAMNTAAVTASAAPSASTGSSAQIQPITVPQTVGTVGSNIVMVDKTIKINLSFLCHVKDHYATRWFLELEVFLKFSEFHFQMLNF